MKYTVEERNRMISLANLKERGWTNSMVIKLLPEPMLFDNPKYRSAAPMKKWWVDEVEQVELTEDFRLLLEKSKKHRVAGQKAAETRRDETLNLIRGAISNLEVVVLPQNLLEQKTLAAKQNWEWQHGNDFSLCNVSEDVLLRWEVNFIRHNLTNYDFVLNSLFGLVGKTEAYNLLKPAVLNQTGKVYPYLKAECDRQKQAM